jgi:hypothetical protein
MQFLNFFLFLWVICALLDPDSANQAKENSNQNFSADHLKSNKVNLIQQKVAKYLPGLCEGGCASETRISLSSTSKLDVSVGEETWTEEQVGKLS